jgi:acetylornithine deacetylase/succinyl-diaminopimelate desuccinylase-like protein
LLSVLEQDVRRAVSFVASVRKLSADVSLRQHVEPGALDEALRLRALRACEALGERCIEMDSGAIHDALKIAKVAPTAMLFVPSVGGKSHTPEEETAPEDLERGLRALAAVVWDLCAPEVSLQPASSEPPTVPA